MMTKMTMLCALLAQGCALYADHPEPEPTLGAACDTDADCVGALRCYHVADIYGCDRHLDEGGPACEARHCSYTSPSVDGHADIDLQDAPCYDGAGYWVIIRNGLDLASDANELLCLPSCDEQACPDGLEPTEWRDICACVPPERP